MPYPVGKGENDVYKDISEIIKAATHIHKSMCTKGFFLLNFIGWAHFLGVSSQAMLQRWGEVGPLSQSHAGETAAPVGLEVKQLNQRWLFSSLKIYWGKKNLLEFVLLGYGLSWDTSPLFNFLFLLFAMRMSILCLSQHCVLEVPNMSGFMSSQLERYCVSG